LPYQFSRQALIVTRPQRECLFLLARYQLFACSRRFVDIPRVTKEEARRTDWKYERRCDIVTSSPGKGR
ncbi:unnamed protein product, partial [Amoebophrya sp. A25]